MRDGLLVGALLLLAGLAGCADGATEEAAQDAPTGMLAGVVVTEAIVPIPGAEVRVAGTEVANLTDAKGEFLVGPLEAGTYELRVEAEGYSRTTVTAQVAARGENRVSVVLPAVSTDVPYHEVEHFSAYVECSYAQRFAGVVGGNFNCLGITDLLLGIKIDNDRAEFPVEIRGGGFQGILVEIVWDPQATMPHWSGYLRDPVGAGGGVGLESQYWSAVDESPIIAWVLQGIENDGAYGGDVFHPDPNATAEYMISVTGMSDTSEPVDVAIALEQELEIFISRFYHELPGGGYGIVDA